MFDQDRIRVAINNKEVFVTREEYLKMNTQEQYGIRSLCDDATRTLLLDWEMEYYHELCELSEPDMLKIKQQQEQMFENGLKDFLAGKDWLNKKE